MKLNLGCGTEYKAGYINIDAYDLTVADKKMEVTDLKFPDNSAKRLEASQLIEHLGSIHIIYALNEWIRVFEPKGTLLIETPDVETSFKEYLRGDQEVKRELLVWIYGFDVPGMQHKYCFSLSALESLLRKTGFEGIISKKFLTPRNEPVLQIVCEKPRLFQPSQTVALFRKKLSMKKVIDIDDQIIAQDQEKVIDFFVSTLKKYLKNGKTELLDDIVIDGAVHSPIMAHLFLQECSNQGLIGDSDINSKLKVLESLHRFNLPNLLFHSLRKSPMDEGEQERKFDTICEFGRDICKKLLYSSEEERSSVIVSLANLYEEYKIEEQINFFSEYIVKYRAYFLHSRGRKFFTLKKYEEAINEFTASISLDRTNPIYYWNMARVYATVGNYSHAIENYKISLRLKNYINLANADKIEQLLKNELAICYSNLRGGAPPENVIIEGLGGKDRSDSDMNDITNILTFQKEKLDHNYLREKGKSARVLNLLENLKKRIKILMNHKHM
jgi:predicted SAM-dependent methyltransferase/tetratricopeptide (TPR) repeat protein